MAAAGPSPDDWSMTTCLIADDHEDVLDAVSAYLSSEGYEVVGLASTAADAIRLLEEFRPDVAVLDYQLPDATGIDIVRGLSAGGPTTATVLLSGEVTRSIVAEALATGISGVVLKESAPATLTRAIETVLSGKRYVDPQLRRT
jgi:two-component system, NarL family, nitrate/nitrite response regulator NarL